MVVFGRDDGGKAHASWFGYDETPLAEKAAGMMRMSALSVTSDELRGLASRLPHGRVFASGKAFVPFVKEDVFRKLEAYLPVAARQTARTPAKRSTATAGAAPPAAGETGKAVTANSYAAAKESGKPPSEKYPDDWGNIKVGNIVLASAERDDGWWTAHVREVRPDGSYLLEWEEWAGFDRFVRRPEQIALLHPAYNGK
jgi:hypothetical protein